MNKMKKMPVATISLVFTETIRIDVNRLNLQSVHARTFRLCHETPEEWGGWSHGGPLRWIVGLLVSQDGVDERLIRGDPDRSSVSFLKLLILSAIMAG